MLVKHIAREQVTVSNAVKTLTSATITNSVIYADIQVTAYPIRYTIDGSTAPVAATTGKLWTPNSEKRVWGIANLKNLKFIREGDDDATVIVTYWGMP